MDHRRFFTQIVTTIFSGEGVHRVRPQLSELGSFRDSLQNRFLDADLVHADRGVNHERGHPGILANRAHVVAGHVHVRQDNIERLG